MICESCKYAFYYSQGAHPGCNYINATGNTRDCAPGDGCTRYENGTPEELARERRDKAATRAIKERNRKKSADKKPINKQKKEKTPPQPRGRKFKYTQEQISEVQALKRSGKSTTEISNITGISPKTIRRYTKDIKEEPAAAATVTDSEQNIMGDISADIISDNSENVKSPQQFSPMAADAIWKQIEELRKEASDLIESEFDMDKIIADCRDKIYRLDEQLIRVEAEIDILMADYEAVTGGKA